MSESADRRRALSDLVAESKRLMDKSAEISRQLAEVQTQIEVRAKELMDAKLSSTDIPIVDPLPKK